MPKKLKIFSLKIHKSAGIIIEKLYLRVKFLWYKAIKSFLTKS